MKKLLFITVMTLVLTIFSGCQDDQEIDDLQSNDNVLAQNETNPDVISENGYLIFNNLESAESLLTELNNFGDEDLLVWEKSMKFESARSHRAKLNNSILRTDDYSLFDKMVKQATLEGYFDSDELCMTYPFNRSKWASILNKEGIVKIGETLYSFNKNGGHAIHKGDLGHLKMIKEGKQLPKTLDYCNLGSKLKSVTLSDYGFYFKDYVTTGKYTLWVELYYDDYKLPTWVWDPQSLQFILVDMPKGVKYDLYCHQRVKRWYGTFDQRTYLSHKAYDVKVGGNVEPSKNWTFARLDYSNANPIIEQSSQLLSNHYIELYSSTYPFHTNYPDQPAPSVSPRIDLIKFDVWSNRSGSVSNCVEMRIY